MIKAMVVMILAAAAAQTGLAQDSSERPVPVLQKSDFRLVQTHTRKQISLDEMIDKAISDLGKPKNMWMSFKGESPKWDIFTYDYDGVSVQAFRGTEPIVQIQTSSTEYRTPRGIRVGSKVEDVTTAYGKPDFEDATTMTYYGQMDQNGRPFIYFYYSAGFVVSITISDQGD